MRMTPLSVGKKTPLWWIYDEVTMIALVCWIMWIMWPTFNVLQPVLGSPMISIMSWCTVDFDGLPYWESIAGCVFRCFKFWNDNIICFQPRLSPPAPFFQQATQQFHGREGWAQSLKMGSYLYSQHIAPIYGHVSHWKGKTAMLGHTHTHTHK